MEPKIYTSSFRTGPDATKKQQMLFATDTAYALSEGYYYIRDSRGSLFEILDANNLIEVVGLDEDTGCIEPKETPFDPTIDNKPVEDTNCKEDLTDLQAIDRIISNTLHQSAPITVDQAKSMFYLAQTKRIMQMSTDE